MEQEIPARRIAHHLDHAVPGANGNPKGIKDWEDLIKPGVQVIVVNPKTGGNGRYAYLAAWGAIREKGGSRSASRRFVSELLRNVPVLAKGGA